MAMTSGDAPLGAPPELSKEMEAFGEAVASDDAAVMAVARQALLEARHEHAVLDAAAIAAFFCSITKVVDFAGHYNEYMKNLMAKVSFVSETARQIRETLLVPIRVVLPESSSK